MESTCAREHLNVEILNVRMIFIRIFCGCCKKFGPVMVFPGLVLYLAHISCMLLYVGPALRSENDDYKQYYNRVISVTSCRLRHRHQVHRETAVEFQFAFGASHLASGCRDDQQLPSDRARCQCQRDADEAVHERDDGSVRGPAVQLRPAARAQVEPRPRQPRPVARQRDVRRRLGNGDQRRRRRRRRRRRHQTVRRRVSTTWYDLTYLPISSTYLFTNLRIYFPTFYLLTNLLAC